MKKNKINYNNIKIKTEFTENSCSEEYYIALAEGKSYSCIVCIRYFHNVPGFQKLSKTIVTIVNNKGILKINIVVVGPSMIGDLG